MIGENLYHHRIFTVFRQGLSHESRLMFENVYEFVLPSGEFAQMTVNFVEVALGGHSK